MHDSGAQLWVILTDFTNQNPLQINVHYNLTKYCLRSASESHKQQKNKTNQNKQTQKPQELIFVKYETL